jgi:hypothetical protein
VTVAPVPAPLARRRWWGVVVPLLVLLGLPWTSAHSHQNLERVGDWVERGEVIGSVASTGRSTAPHLHFEVRLEGRKYDPLFWLPPAGSMDVASSATRAPGSPR